MIFSESSYIMLARIDPFRVIYNNADKSLKFDLFWLAFYNIMLARIDPFRVIYNNADKSLKFDLFWLAFYNVDRSFIIDPFWFILYDADNCLIHFSDSFFVDRSLIIGISELFFIM